MNNDRSENRIEKTIKSIVLCLVLLVWSIIGMIVWIPLLSRAVAVYSFSIIPLTLSGNRDAIARIAIALNAATSFYVNGFKLALNAMRSEVIQEPLEEQKEQPLSLEKTIKEIMVSTAFWLVFAFSWGWRPSLSPELISQIDFLFWLSVKASVILALSLGGIAITYDLFFNKRGDN